MSPITLMVCPHDLSSAPDRWYRLCQYCAAHLDLQVHFEMALDFEEFHQGMATADLVYANPSDTLTLVAKHGFRPLMRADGAFDEVIFLAHPEIHNPSLSSLQGADIATVTNLLPTKIALRMLKQHQITPAKLIDTSSWTAVIGTVWRGEANYGLIYKDTFEGLSNSSRQMVNPFLVSDEQVAFHSLCLGPRMLERAATLSQVLQQLHTHTDGQALLQELGVSRWVPVSSQEWNGLKQIALN